MDGTRTVHAEHEGSAHLTARTLDSTIDLQSHQAEWEGLRKRCGGSIFSSFDWSIEWLRHFDTVASPRIIMVEEDGVLVGLAPLTVTEERAMGVKVMRLSLVGDGAGVAELYDLGVLVSEDREDVLDKMVQEIARLEWNVMQLNQMRDSPANRGLLERISHHWEAEDVSTVPCPGTSLPAAGSVLDIISPRTRSAVIRAMGSLEEEGRIRYRCVDIPAEARDATEMYALKHMARSEARGREFSYESLSSFLQDVMMATVAEGWGMVYEVWIDGSLAAQMLCLEDGDVMHAYRLGAGDRFPELSPGNLVSLYAMNEARHAGFTYFDFGPRAEEFKYRLGARDRHLLCVEALRGTARAASMLTSLPGVRRLVSR